MGRFLQPSVPSQALMRSPSIAKVSISSLCYILALAGDGAGWFQAHLSSAMSLLETFQHPGKKRGVHVRVCVCVEGRG